MIHKSMNQLVPATNIMFLLLPNVFSLTPFLYKKLFLCDFPKQIYFGPLTLDWPCKPFLVRAMLVYWLANMSIHQR